MKKERIILFGIIFLGLFLRIAQLGKVPFGFTYDELGYIFNAYSVGITGKNVFGELLPIFTWMVPHGYPFMPVPIYFAAPFYWILPLTPFTAQLPAVLLGTADILLIFLFVKLLTKRSSLALLSSLFLAISPWHIHFSRTAYDTNYSVFFYLLGIVLFLFEIQKKRLPFLSLFAFLVGIFSYRGMSIFGMPLLFFLPLYAKFSLHATKKQLISFLCGVGLIFVLLGVTISIYKSSYTQEGQSLFNSPTINQTVNEESRDAKGPLILKRIFLNKPAVITKQLVDNYLQTFTPNFLFLYGEGNGVYSMWTQGKLYTVDLPFILLGVASIFSMSSSIGIFLVALFLLGALPGGIGGSPYSSRDLFMSVIFPIFTSAGIIWIYSFKYFQKIRLLVVIVLILVYAYSLSSYLFDYYYRYAYATSELWATSLKIVSRDITDKQKKYNEIVVGPTSHGDFIQFAFYAHLTPQEVQKVWIESHSSYGGPFVYKNISFISSCPNSNFSNSVLVITRGNCYKYQIPKLKVTDFSGNTIWREYSYGSPARTK